MVFRFRLAQVQKLRERERDAAADALSQAKLAESKLNEEIDRVLREHADQVPLQSRSGQGNVNPQQIMESQRFQVHLMSQVAQLREQLELVRTESERRRQMLVKREQGVRALEQLEEHQRAEAAELAEQQSQTVLDEWASFHHWKQSRS